MPGCKAPEILRSEAYLNVRRNDEGRGQRRRWAFFNSPSRPDTGAPDFTLQSLNDDSQIKELHPNTKESRNLSLQLCYGRLLCPKVVNVVVELFAHRHLVRSRVDVP